MKLFVNNFPKEWFEDKFKELEHIDFSLFVDYLPKSEEDLSPINVIVMQEPNDYFLHHDWAIKNKHVFSLILTWSDRVLNSCENARFLPFGHTWFKPDQYAEDKDKKFELTHLRGNLLKTYGHVLRHELLDRQNEIIIPKNFYEIYGDRYNVEDARLGKEKLFGNSMFGIAIENTQYNGYFTEKIMDCFLQKTIPIYWGCSNIEKYFDLEGIITFTSVDDAINKINKLDEDYYWSKIDVIKRNYHISLQYVDYQQNVYNEVEKAFKHNNLI